MTEQDQAQGPPAEERDPSAAPTADREQAEASEAAGDDVSPAAVEAGHDEPQAGDVADERPVVLATHGLTKRFGKILAVDHLDLTVRRGDVFGFLGPNGAGKTTTIRMIFGLIFPTSGYAEVLDHRVPGQRVAALRHLGGFVEVPAFYPTMSARRNLRLLGSAGGHPTEERIAEVLDTVGLLSRADSKVSGYSHGMKQRLGIANALLGRPEVIILDEPTSGLDPQGMKDVRELVRELGAAGTTVLLSSHLLHEVEQVCNRAVIINKGRTVIEGPVATLRPREEAVKIVTDDQQGAKETASALFGGRAVTFDEGNLIVRAGDEGVPELVRRLVAQGIAVRAVVPAVEQGLEDFFLELTQSSDVDSGRGERAAAQSAAAPPAGEGRG
ncbi:MAG TPA: ABC transporter ATP-binding protein [Thermoleophilia bacterium]|nr:ABC transporter ATP-binding protein [Thermoleophilia bacterium]